MRVPVKSQLYAVVAILIPGNVLPTCVVRRDCVDVHFTQQGDSNAN